MSEQAVQFQRIRIDRTPGVPRGSGFELDELSPGVNLIHGPNGSGKSTTGRAIQQALWPSQHQLARASLAARLKAGGNPVSLELDGGHLLQQPDPPLKTGPPEHRGRYHLDLHELVQSSDAGFARAVAEAMQGGYDLEAAAGELSLTERPGPRHHKRKPWDQARQKVQEAERAQQELDREARELAGLKQARQRATAARRNVALLQQAAAHHEHAEQCRHCQIQLEQYPDAVAKLTGQERRQADDLAGRIEKRKQQQRELRQKVQQAREALQKTGLPENGLDEQALLELKARLETLQRHQQETERLDRELAGLANKRDQARQRLSEHLNDEQLARLQRIELPELTDYARQVQQYQAQRSRLAEQRRWLEEASETTDQGNGTNDVASRLELQPAITALARWLAAVRSKRDRRWFYLAIGLAGAALLFSSCLAYWVHPLWLIAGLLAAAPPAVMGYLQHEPGGVGSDEQAVHRRSFERTGLPGPSRWELDAVATRLDQLHREAARLSLAEEKATRLKAVAGEEEQLEQTRRQLAAKQDHVAAVLGIAPPVETAWLGQFIETLRHWQTAAAEHESQQSRREELNRQIEEELERFNELAQPAGAAAAETVDSARACYEDLQARQQQHREASQQCQDAEATLSRQVEPELKELEQQHRRLFGDLGLAEGDTATLDHWLSLREGYQAAREALSKARAIRDEKRSQLQQHRPQLLEMDEPTLQQHLEAEQHEAAKEQELSDRIARTEERIAQAKQGHQLEEALQQRDEAAEQLRQAREEDTARVIGALLTEHVRARTADQTRPRVLNRASELFARITQGRYELKLSEGGDTPAFLAYDAVEARDKRLDQLSTGERVQLLLSVRIAFVEQEERGAMLPLLMDETLGTSDDQRAAAIMAAVTEIARTGRQIFYFTAQPDEIGKWQAHLQQSEMPHATFDLAAIRRLSSNQQPLTLHPPQRETVPAPNGEGYVEYGKRLGAAGLDPHHQTVAQVHLWHFLEEPKQLHAMVSRGIERWGQLRVLLQSQGEALLPEGLTPDGLKAAARAVEAALENWRVGRDRPVDGQALAEADGVTERFLPDLRELAAQVAGNPRQLLARAENIKGWGQAKNQQLETYLYQAGYLSDGDPLTADTLRARILAAVSADLRAGRLSQAWVDRLLRSLPQPPAAAAGPEAPAADEAAVGAG
jgi:uncharacterized protein YhaN